MVRVRPWQNQVSDSITRSIDFSIIISIFPYWPISSRVSNLEVCFSNMHGSIFKIYGPVERFSYAQLPVSINFKLCPKFKDLTEKVQYKVNLCKFLKQKTLQFPRIFEAICVVIFIFYDQSKFLDEVPIIFIH